MRRTGERTPKKTWVNGVLAAREEQRLPVATEGGRGARWLSDGDRGGLRAAAAAKATLGAVAAATKLCTIQTQMSEGSSPQR